MRRSREGAGIGFEKTDWTGASHDLHRRSSHYQTDGLGGAWPRPAVRAPGKNAHRCTAKGPARRHHRDPVPGPQGHCWQRKGRRVGEDCGKGA